MSQEIITWGEEKMAKKSKLDKRYEFVEKYKLDTWAFVVLIVGLMLISYFRSP